MREIVLLVNSTIFFAKEASVQGQLSNSPNTGAEFRKRDKGYRCTDVLWEYCLDIGGSASDGDAGDRMVHVDTAMGRLDLGNRAQ